MKCSLVSPKESAALLFFRHFRGFFISAKEAGLMGLC